MIYALFGLVLILATLYIFVLLLNLYMGGYVTERLTKKILATEFDKIKITDNDTLIISVRYDDYHIYKDVATPLAKYYIHYYGAVPRWSKLHDKIEYYYSIAKEEE